MMKLKITENDVERMKTDLRTVLSDVKSSHRVEALARGLGWRTNAAMRVALAGGPVEVFADDSAFRDYLREHSFDTPEHTLSRALAKIGIHRAMDIEPNLTHFGYGVFAERKTTAEERQVRFNENRARMLDDYSVGEFVRASDFLSRYGRRKTLNRKSTSYGLKHKAEDLAGAYVSNGMLIAAALALGFSAQPTDPGSPNAWFNISSKAYVAADDLAEAA
jgi:hypothetical protein